MSNRIPDYIFKDEKTEKEAQINAPMDDEVSPNYSDDEITSFGDYMHWVALNIPAIQEKLGDIRGDLGSMYAVFESHDAALHVD